MATIIGHRVFTVMIAIGATAPMTMTQLAISVATATSAEAGITRSFKRAASTIGDAIRKTAAGIGTAAG